MMKRRRVHIPHVCTKFERNYIVDGESICREREKIDCVINIQAILQVNEAYDARYKGIRKPTG